MTLLNVGSSELFKLLVLVCLSVSDLYLFHLVVLLNSVFNCSNNLLSSSVNKVTIGTYSFVSFVLNVVLVGALISSTAASALGSPVYVIIAVKTQFTDLVKMRFISQIMAYLKFSKKYFNGTKIFF